MIVIMRDAVMPECCKTCVCSEGYGCGITGTEMTTKEMESRPDWCPLEEVEPCEDAVSRDDVLCNIDKLVNQSDDGLLEPEDVIVSVSYLPSVTPKQRSFSCGQENDLISRKAAIDAFLTELTKRERKNLLHTWSTVEVKYFVAGMLEKMPSAQPVARDINVLSSDLISRQAAINAICEDGTWLERQGCTEITMVERKQRDVDILEALTSAQPDLLDAKEKDNRKKTEGYICGDTGEACTDCVEKCIYKHSLAEECEAVPEGGKKMMDLIERQMAIDALGERPMVWTDDDEYALGERSQYDIDRSAIETVPSAQTEMDCMLKEYGDCTYSETGCSGCAIKANIKKALKSAQPEPCEDAVSRADVKVIVSFECGGWCGFAKTIIKKD